MNKKTKIAIIGIIALVLVTIGITYAYWLITRTQQGENVITTGCLDITLNGSGDISLSNQFPMSDEDGMKLTPYTFTVTNNCNTSVDYQIALEALESGDEIASDALKVALNDTTKLYSAYGEIDTTIDGAYESRAVGFSRLAAKGNEGSTASYELRIWVDAEASIDEMNKTFKSKIAVTVGQGIESPYEEGTIAYDILANYGGANATVAINPDEYDEYSIVGYAQSVEYEKKYYWGTEINFDNTTGLYTLGGIVVDATIDECRSGQKNDGTTINCLYTLSNTEKPDYKANASYKVTSLTNLDFEDASFDGVNYTMLTTERFASVIKFANGTNMNNGSVYQIADDYGTSYYFRGNVNNNYVKFGTYTEDDSFTAYDNDARSEKTIEIKAGAPMYWRIVRINGDGTIRLVYDGTEKAENGTSHNTIIKTSEYDSLKNIGYTYETGTENHKSSTIKDVLDNWYDVNLKSSFDKYISDSIFCNDKTVTSSESESYGVINKYGSFDRVWFSDGTTPNPQLICTNKADRYTVNDVKNGNGLLSNPVGLLTADEVSLAGLGVFVQTDDSIKNNYLKSNFRYWLLSPAESTIVGENIYTQMFESSSGPSFDYSDSKNGVRPVINLKADVQFTGKGTIDSPYEIVMN